MYTIEEFDKSKSKVLKYVLYKKRSKQEVKNKFTGTIESEMLNDIIEELQENNYINDYNYIERSINEFKALKNLSVKEVKYKLITKGIDKSQLEEYIYNNEDELIEYEIDSARKIIIKKQGTMEEEDIKQYLLKRGFLSNRINEAINQIN